MIYAVGLFGFVGGFALGQMLLYFLLRNRTKEELLEDKNLKLKYGLLSWGITIFSTYCFVQMYKQYFG